MQIGWLSAGLLLILVLLEVASRPLGLPYFFGSEFGSSLMAWITFFALSEVGRRREHISARFLLDLMPARAQRLIDALFSGVFFFIYVVLLPRPTPMARVPKAPCACRSPGRSSAWSWRLASSCCAAP
jgi:TRAP-type C4-dicarboxylate transport system permease small subunit